MSGELSSDVLERQFGHTTLEVLRQSDAGRVIATKAADSGQVLELSQVTFRSEGIAAFAGVHRRVLAGTSIGKAFREAGVAFERHVRTVYRGEAPAVFNGRFKTAGEITALDVLILAGPGAIPYADILEVYSPDVSWSLPPAGSDRELLAGLRAFGETLAARATGHTS